MSEEAKARRFREIALPHLDAAYNLARWLMRNEADAEDMVQDAYLRAFRYFDGFGGDDARPWLLSIVRHACYDGLRRRGADRAAIDADASLETIDAVASGRPDPETELSWRSDKALLDALIMALPPPLREVLVLRELEDLSYRAIAEVAGIPLGTVMSRLARARSLLLQARQRQQAREAPS